ncbi:MAG: gliding motility-associated C-terminal domain-containing protein [Chitinophagales bacterium]|nr:gliding motility-associated C-terminal domain-containing protein [Chitinophagales bacterium]
MKNNMQHSALKILFTLITLVFIPITLLATHNRAGEITYIYQGDLTFDFTITTYTDPNSPADRNELIIYYGDGVFDTVIRSSILVLTSSIQQNKYTRSHQYAAEGSYTIYMQDPNRVDGINNIEGSVNVPFYLETILTMPDALLFGNNSSVQLTNYPIDYANVGETFTHNPGAYDPDGDALRFSLIVPRQAPGINVPGYQYPDEYTDCDDTFTIDSLTGDVVWEVPCVPGIFVIAILIEEFRDGIFVGSVSRDMQIEVLDNPNHAPFIEMIADTCVFAGEDLIKLITANDPDIGQKLTLTATGGPFTVDISPATFISTPTINSVNGTFQWETECEHVRKEFYQVIFKVQDDYKLGVTPQPLTYQRSWIIYVVGPPPLNLTAEPQGNKIQLQWDSLYQCYNSDNFIGFTVWRKTACDTSEFDICQRGLEGTDYELLDSVYVNHSYTDFDVVHGQIYSYRILAEFAENSDIVPTFYYNRVSSNPSNGACAELKRDLPIINHVSVNTTDVENGSMYLQWYNPDPIDLDTIQNPGPYQYVIKRYEGFDASGSETEIATFDYPFFTSITDTSFVDTFLNTVFNPYTYTIDFITSEGLLGTSTSASSIYLTSAPADNKVILSWNFNVPWTNFKYDVYKEIPIGSGNFDSIATVETAAYTDMNLANGVEQCYRIKGFGNYTAESLPADTLINYSQIKCETPIDNELPCAPVLTVTNICDTDDPSFDPADLRNDLSWTNPNLSCADDVIGYYIYYATTQSATFAFLDSVQGAENIEYSHKNLESLAGCYAVVAIDSFYNESVLSNKVCVDNCSDYILPNVFTPNGDGANDLYTPVLPYRFIDHVNMQIFNRWGALVFESTDPILNWDGTDINSGKDLEEGTYYYVCDVYEITVNGVSKLEKPLSGYIHLIRADK